MKMNDSTLTMNDIRDYLLDSNAIEEAESILLHNILNRSHQAIQGKVIKDHLYQDIESNLSNSNEKVKDSNKEIDNLRIYDLLGNYETEIKMIEKDKYDKKQNEIIKMKTIEDNYEKVKLINDITKKELINLDLKKDFIINKYMNNKQELDKLNILYNQKETNGIINSDLAYVSKNMLQPLPNKMISNIKEFQDLNEEHARRLIQNKTESLAYKKELELMKIGKWNLDASYLKNPNALLETSNHGIPNKLHSNGSHSINNNHDINNNKVGNDISNSMQSNSNSNSDINKIVRLLASKNQLDEMITAIPSDNVDDINNDNTINNNNSDIDDDNSNNKSSNNDIKPVSASSRVESLLKSLQQDNENVAKQDQYIVELKEQAKNEKSNLTDDEVFNQLTKFMHKDQQKPFNYDQVSNYFNQVSPRPMPNDRIIAKNVRAADFLEDWLNKAVSPSKQPIKTNNAYNNNHNNNVSNRNNDSNVKRDNNVDNIEVPTSNSRGYDHSNSSGSRTARENKEDPYFPLKRDKGNNRLNQQPQQQQAGLNVLNQFRNNIPIQQQQQPEPPQHIGSYPHSQYQQQQPITYYPNQSQMQNPSSFNPNNNPIDPNMFFAGAGAGMNQVGPLPYYPAPIGGIAPFPALAGVPNAAAIPYYMQQHNELSHVQKLTERLEQENMKLIQHLDSSEHPMNPYNMGSNMSDMSSINSDNLDSRHTHDYDQLFPLERDRRNGYPIGGVGIGGKDNQGLSIRERKHNEEIKRIQNEIERLKCQKELDEVQAYYNKQKKIREKELEQEEWLEKSKQELQKLKLQQVLEKEQKLLKLQQDESNMGYNNDDNEYKLLNPSQIKQLKIESGVQLTPISLDIASGISIIADGIILPDEILKNGNLFRLALGIYDKSGKSLQRLNASEWQEYKLNTEGNKDNLQPLNGLIMHSFKIKDIKYDLSTNRALLELQTKQREDTTIQKSIGWVVTSFININTEKDISSNANLMNNNAWRGILRKGITDPAISNTDISKPPNNKIPDAWILFRIIENNELTTATAWNLSSSSLITDKHALSFYTDLYNRNQSRPPDNLFSERNLTALPRPSSKRPSNSRETLSRGNDSVTSNKPDKQGIDDNESIDSETGFPSHTNKAGKAMNALKAVSRFNKGKKALEKLEESNEENSLKNMNNDEDEIKSIKDEEDNHPMMMKTAEDSSYWFPGTPLGPCTSKYQRGDGIDIYIDSCMSLPDHCTVSRIVMRIFTIDKEQIGGVYEEYSYPGSVSTSPTFSLRAELRGPSINTTAIVVIRIDTICSVTMLPSTVGYTICRIFATKDRDPISSPIDNNGAYINTGSFQLPVYGGRLNPNVSIFNDSMTDNMPKIPCASLLMRIVNAPKSKDGISTLSRDEFASDEWKHLGLDIPAPLYSSGAYYSALCEPNEKELICFRIKKQYNETESVESALLQAMSSATASTNNTKKPTSNNPTDMIDWFKSLFPPHASMKRSLDYAFTVPYAIESGLSLSVDGLYNMPENSLFSNKSTIYKVITSTSPPAVFYKTPPLLDEVYYTKTHDLEAHWRAPRFNDGYYTFHPPVMADNLYIILDIRIVHIESNEVINIESPSSRKSYWSLLPLSMEKIPSQGFSYVQSGIFHLPLFEGPVPADDLFKTSNPYVELKNRLKLKNKDKNNIKVMDGSMNIIKVLNPLIDELIMKTEFNISKPMIQTVFMNFLLDIANTGSSQNNAKKEKFIYDITKYPSNDINKSTSAQLPKLNNDIPALIRNINKTFESKTGIGMKL